MINEERVKGGQFAVVLASFLFFFKIHPYFFWSAFFTNNYFEAFVTIIIGYLFFVNGKKREPFETLLFVLMCIIVTLYPITIKQNLNVFISVAPIVFIPFATNIFKEKVYDCFLNIYCTILVISFFFWLLHFTGILTPDIVPPLNDNKVDNYRIYPFVALEGSSFRFAGPFDEPGVIGTISALFLCTNNIRLNNVRNIILLLSGFCSVSLFFYVIVGAYWILSRIQSTKKAIMAIAIFALAVYMVQSVPILKEMIGDRLVWDSDTGTIAGDNRTAMYSIETLNRVQGTSEFWFGVNDKVDFMEKTSFSSSFLNVILLNGMLYFLIVLSFYILYGWYYRRDILSFILFLIVFLAVVFQRPYFNNPYYVFLWTCLARRQDEHIVSSV